MLRLRSSLGWLALAALSGPARAMPLPFTIDNPHGEWRALSVQQEVAQGLTIETVIVHDATQTRFFLLHAPKADPAPAEFITKVKQCFPTYQSTSATENEAKEMGFDGHDLQFDLVNAKETLTCELFVFAHDHRWWGVLHVRPKNNPSGLPSTFSMFHPRPELPPDVVGMQPLRVRDTPLTSFPISLEVTSDRATHHVAHIIINEVPAGSITEQMGLKVGDEIIAVNGRKATDYKSGLGKDSELGLIFLNREPGDEVELEIIYPNAKKPRTVVLRVPRLQTVFPR